MKKFTFGAGIALLATVLVSCGSNANTFPKLNSKDKIEFNGSKISRYMDYFFEYDGKTKVVTAGDWTIRYDIDETERIKFDTTVFTTANLAITQSKFEWYADFNGEKDVYSQKTNGTLYENRSASYYNGQSKAVSKDEKLVPSHNLPKGKYKIDDYDYPFPLVLNISHDSFSSVVYDELYSRGGEAFKNFDGFGLYENLDKGTFYIDLKVTKNTMWELSSSMMRELFGTTADNINKLDFELTISFKDRALSQVNLRSNFKSYEDDETSTEEVDINYSFAMTTDFKLPELPDFSTYRTISLADYITQ
jgi:hypothetical protein